MARAVGCAAGFVSPCSASSNIDMLGERGFAKSSRKQLLTCYLFQSTKEFRGGDSYERELVIPLLPSTVLPCPLRMEPSIPYVDHVDWVSRLPDTEVQLGVSWLRAIVEQYDRSTHREADGYFRLRTISGKAFRPPLSRRARPWGHLHRFAPTDAARLRRAIPRK
jgi:hypothetical protein